MIITEKLGPALYKARAYNPLLGGGHTVMIMDSAHVKKLVILISSCLPDY